MEYLSLYLFLAVCLLLMLGYPVAFTLAGTALAFAGALYDIDVEVWQVGASYDQKPYRRIMMETFGGTVHRSPSPLTALS